MSDFNGKTIIITGGTSGIGKATAQHFLEKGANVIITSRKQENLDSTIQELGGKLTGFVSDAGNWNDLQDFGNQIKNLTDQVDILFVNAGFGKFTSLADADEAIFDGQFNALVKGGYFTVQKTLPFLKEGSSVIFNTSIVTDIAMPGASIYGAAKSAVAYFTRSFANEFKDSKIRVNAVSPGPIGTNFFNEAGVPAEQQEQMASNILSQVPMNRFGAPEEIAKTVAFLASEDSSFITGHEIQVDGGMAQI